MTLGLFNPFDWDHILNAMKDGRWEAAKNLLVERDNRLDAAFDTQIYAPTLTQDAATATASPSTRNAQIVRIDRVVIFQWNPHISSVAGKPVMPPIYISLPPQFSAAESNAGYIGASQFSTKILSYHSGGVELDSENSRLVTWPNEVPYASPVHYAGDLNNLQSIGFFCAWRLPVSKLSR